MEKLKKLIEQHSRWQPLDEYIQRIEAHIETDFSLCIENSKALIETICKEICSIKKTILKGDESINKLMKITFDSIGYEINSPTNVISGALSSIAHQIGNLRTSQGITSHGKTLKELEERNKQTDDIAKEFLIDTIVIVASLLIKSFETENSIQLVDDASLLIQYATNEEFNNYWDDIYGEFAMGDYSYTASEILYNVDYKAYEIENKEFNRDQE